MNLKPFAKEDMASVETMRDAAAAKFLSDTWADGLRDNMFNDTVGFLGFDAGELIGAVVFTGCRDGDGYASFLVAPDARGRGVGEELLRRALVAAELRRATANVEPENVASRRCIEKVGFVEKFGHAGPFYEWLATPVAPPEVLSVEALLPPALADLSKRCSTLQDLDRQEDVELALGAFLALHRHAEGAYDLEGVEMYAGDYGWADDAAAKLRLLACRVQQDQSASLPVVLSGRDGQAMVRRWAEHAVWP